MWWWEEEEEEGVYIRRGMRTVCSTQILDFSDPRSKVLLGRLLRGRDSLDPLRSSLLAANGRFLQSGHHRQSRIIVKGVHCSKRR